MESKEVLEIGSTDGFSLFDNMRGNLMTHEIIIKNELRCENIDIIIVWKLIILKCHTILFEWCLLGTGMIF